MEEMLVRYCSPTLAGIKTGNLFRCPFTSQEELNGEIRRLNGKLRAKGLRVLPLRFSDRGALIYVYRPERLKEDLARAEAEEILSSRGYESCCPTRCIIELIQRLRTEEEFPHEIGLFLSYPPEDVRGFMEQGPKCCKCTGCWKVYGDAEAAKKTFRTYERCTADYLRQMEKGNPIERLAVAN